MARAWVGTSGYEYDHWKGVLYPEGLPRKDRLRRYAETFNALEVNATFYRLAKAERVDVWRRTVEEVNADFRFVLKGSQFITHSKKLKDAREALRRFFAPVERLGDRCSGVLWQLSPWRANVERIERFVEDLDATSPRGWWHAMEFRHGSWFRGEVFDVLRDAGVAVVHGDMPMQVLAPGQGARRIPRPSVHAPLTAAFVYLRRHGPVGGFGGGYSSGMTETDARHTRAWLAQGRDVFAFFNNDPGGHAVRDAERLARRVGAEPRLRGPTRAHAERWRAAA